MSIFPIEVWKDSILKSLLTDITDNKKQLSDEQVKELTNTVLTLRATNTLFKAIAEAFIKDNSANRIPINLTIFSLKEMHNTFFLVSNKITVGEKKKAGLLGVYSSIESKKISGETIHETLKKQEKVSFFKSKDKALEFNRSNNTERKYLEGAEIHNVVKEGAIIPMNFAPKKENITEFKLENPNSFTPIFKTKTLKEHTFFEMNKKTGESIAIDPHPDQATLENSKNMRK